MHYSGVWDYKAVADHPDWAAINANGKPNDKATSVFGPYADTLMIPQLRELAGEYGADGVWVDGDCWGTTVDYGAAAVSRFCEQTGAKAAPRKAGEPYGTSGWTSIARVFDSDGDTVKQIFCKRAGNGTAKPCVSEVPKRGSCCNLELPTIE
ncbi:MAG: hypothetical protein H8E73_02115 [Planctomycetes bacterium]|nr:hypothetical protein [Planctomycetota bacterium]